VPGGEHQAKGRRHEQADRVPEQRAGDPQPGEYEQDPQALEQ